MTFRTAEPRGPRNYRATVHREGDWWVIDVDGVGATQAKRLDKIEHMARDLVASMRDVPIDDVQVDVTFSLAPELDQALSAAKAASEAARATQKAASQAVRKAVTQLQDEDWSLRDIAWLTGVSFQRVHQLTSEAIEAAVVDASRVTISHEPGRLVVTVHERPIAPAEETSTGSDRSEDRAGV